MLYGDDDTLFYMSGVIKLLEQFDPEQPLAITDNIWYFTQHPAPAAPRCLPCGFNLSSIVTNHTFTPRAACPFCTRALACGTYAPRYRCNATHEAALRERFGPRLLTFPLGPQEGAGEAGGGEDSQLADANSEEARERFAGGMREAGAAYAKWMAHHVELKERYPRDFKYKPAMDWEQRDPPPPGPTGLPRSEEPGSEDTDPQTWYGGRRRRRRRGRRAQRRRRGLLLLLQQGEEGDGEDGEGEEGEGEAEEEDQEVRETARWRRTRRRRGLAAAARAEAGGGPGEAGEDQLGDVTLEGDEEEYDDDVGWDGAADASGAAAETDDGDDDRYRPRARRRLAGAKRPSQQRYIDGTPWLSAALGMDLSRAAEGDAAAREAREALRLPFPYCARHDERLHDKPAQSCLVSISGHGGTGVIFSVGLMRLIAPEDAVAFITKQTGCGGGDCLLGRALWFRMGIGYTDPGSPLQHGAARYERYARFVDSNTQMPSLIMLADPTKVLLNARRGTVRAPACDRACVWLIENVVGTHVRAQGKKVDDTVAAMHKHLDTHAAAYAWIQQARADPAVAAGNVSVAQWVRARFGPPPGEKEKGRR
ncbi:hypothetical protein HXX76_015597 [Chlamydomonas incerta]|uniref:Uncharacterized protein n=1 Tax=Chlamydomonas incerta TaxID=51695 RepID=A0A835VRM4_CHLIN|nr:hypothetical protein HXX76_015597 [Chlamydomonas incerta]|eukprot:KAG2422999.1 hypothetical protein HXX76_015597 [Chlamydomonas incerta]